MRAAGKALEGPWREVLAHPANPGKGRDMRNLAQAFTWSDGAGDASRVPAQWHGWLPGAFDDASESHLPSGKIWEADYTPNATGTPQACLPHGSLDRGGKRAKAVGDYEAWSPEG